MFTYYDENGTLPLQSSSQGDGTSVKWENPSKKAWGSFLHNIWPVYLKNIKVIKKKESSRNCHSEEFPMRHDDS